MAFHCRTAPRLLCMIEDLVEQIETRFAELGAQMTDPEVISDRERYAEVGRAYRQLEPAAKLAAQWRRARDDAAGAEELLSEDGEDPELRELLNGARERIEELEEEIRLAMVERDPNDEQERDRRDPGRRRRRRGRAVGGRPVPDADPLRRAAGVRHRADGRRRGQVHVRDSRIRSAPGAYSVFKFEGGTHRVQRVPETESQGRIHTSTATVAVLPEAEEVDVQIDPNDLQIDVYRSSGPGGQSVNTTDSAVRITHKPSGIVVSMQDEKSQLQNRERALRVLRARLYERALAEQQAELAADRRSQVGTGDRAEKIRTYNYGERRVTDHRIKLTVHNLDQVLEGQLDELTAALQADEKRLRLQAQASGVVNGGTPARDALDGAVTAIAAAGCETPRLDAELLLAHVLGVSRERLLTRSRPRRRRPGRAGRSRTPCAAARCEREPVAYITGTSRLSPPGAGRGPPRADPAPGDRAAGRARCCGAAAGRARARRGHRQRRGRAGAGGRAPRPDA